jgi:hypothetical protein
MDKDDIDIHLFLLRRIDNYFQLATFKASLILPADILLMVLLLSKEKSADFLEGNFLEKTIAIVSLHSILISIFFASRAVMAFLKGSRAEKRYQSMIFFGSIAQLPFESFHDEITKIDKNKLSEDIGRQIHLLSKSLTTKFKDINLSIVFLAIGLIAIYLHQITILIDKA